MKSCVAVDPGNNGAIVYLTARGVFQFHVMPVIVNGKSTEIDFEGVERILRLYQGEHVLLERAVSFGMGAGGAFNYGRGFAALEIAIKLLDMSVTYVEPSKWAKWAHQGIEKDLKPKAKSLIAGKRLYPVLFDMIPKGPKSGKPHEGILDALLIAGYGLRG